jgi:dUTP pyrophosphatase
VRKGDRIAQLVLERIVTPDVLETDDLDSTARGAGGFGSTGQSNL